MEGLGWKGLEGGNSIRIRKAGEFQKNYDEIFGHSLILLDIGM